MIGGIYLPKTSLINDRMRKYAYCDIETMYSELDISKQGLSESKVKYMKERYGKNTIITKKTDTLFSRLRRSFINPFTIILFILGIVSFFTDTMLAHNMSENISTVLIISIMLLVSGILRFTQELRSKNATDKISNMSNTIIDLTRNGIPYKAMAEELVVGDSIYLSAGDMIPADVRLVATSDLFVSQAALTGESSILEKSSHKLVPPTDNLALSDYSNLAFMGTTVISGNGYGIVLAVGKDTLYGNFANYTSGKHTSFEHGAHSIALVLIKFMIILVSMIFVIMGITKGDWIEAFLFALSVAVGLTPEMLPMVITTCLAKGSMTLSKKQTIVKNINAMQVFGSMDILCVDKTGTLTNESILLEYYMDVLGNESTNVLDLAYLNSFYHTGMKNPIDEAILKCTTMPSHGSYFLGLPYSWKKVDELPFDYSRNCVSILLQNNQEQLLVTKGSLEEIIKRCNSIEYNDQVIPITSEHSQSISAIVDDMLEDGMKVIAIAKKHLSQPTISPDDEQDLCLLGYLAFFDAPKKTAAEAIQKLKALHVKTKLLTGDNKKVAESICKRVGINATHLMTGSQIQLLSGHELASLVEQVDVFAELTPSQKVQVILALKENGHIVGFMGDGMNDIPAISESDVGISVDTAMDAAKDVADVILLKKDLNVLEEGILSGRKTFANMSKYINITASSNFGNIFSIVCASIFLPFLPMTALQLLLLNLLYDSICITIPWDKVDEDIYHTPREWSGKHLSRFMLFFGPISSLFDMITFVFLYFVICPLMCGGNLYTNLTSPELQSTYITIFQTGWFLESMWTQVLIIYMLRTKRIPFIQSTPSSVVVSVTLIGLVLFTLLTSSSLATLFGMTALPNTYYLYLIIIVPLYMCLTTLAKMIYTRKYKKLF